MAFQNGDSAIKEQPKVQSDYTSALHDELHKTDHSRLAKHTSAVEHHHQSGHLPQLYVCYSQNNEEAVRTPAGTDIFTRAISTPVYSDFERIDGVEVENPPRTNRDAINLPTAKPDSGIFSSFEALDGAGTDMRPQTNRDAITPIRNQPVVSSFETLNMDMSIYKPQQTGGDVFTVPQLPKNMLPSDALGIRTGFEKYTLVPDEDDPPGGRPETCYPVVFHHPHKK